MQIKKKDRSKCRVCLDNSDEVYLFFNGFLPSLSFKCSNSHIQTCCAEYIEWTKKNYLRFESMFVKLHKECSSARAICTHGFFFLWIQIFGTIIKIGEKKKSEVFIAVFLIKHNWVLNFNIKYLFNRKKIYEAAWSWIELNWIHSRNIIKNKQQPTEANND